MSNKDENQGHVTTNRLSCTDELSSSLRSGKVETEDSSVVGFTLDEFPVSGVKTAIVPVEVYSTLFLVAQTKHHAAI